MLLFQERFRPVFAAEGSDGAAASEPGTSASPDSGAASDAAVSPPSGASEVGSEFQGLGGDYDDGEDVVTIPAEVQKVSPPPPVTPETPPVPSAPAKPEAVKAQEPPKAPPDASAAPTTPPAASAAATKDDPEGLVERLSEHREAIIDSLATQRFQLSLQEVDAVTADPAGAVPRLLARAFFESTQASLLHMQNFVPKLVMQLMRDVKEHEAVENKFYGAHTALDRTKHDADVKQFARAFRAANPKITENELFPMVAYAVMAKYGLTAQAAQAPAQQPRSGNGQAPPFVPARPGVGGARVTVSQDESPWMGLGRDYDD